MALKLKDNTHHRNPSGLNNKVRWLLSESNRDVSKMLRLYKSIKFENSKSLDSWTKAISIALSVLLPTLSPILLPTTATYSQLDQAFIL